MVTPDNLTRLEQAYLALFLTFGYLDLCDLQEMSLESQEIFHRCSVMINNRVWFREQECCSLVVFFSRGYREQRELYSVVCRDARVEWSEQSLIQEFIKID